MSAALATLPTAPNVEKAFDGYCALVRESAADSTLGVSAEHNIAIARAWAAWRDLYLVWERTC